MQKLEHELCNLKMKGSEIATYTAGLCDLALLCLGMVTPERKKINKYIWGLTPLTQRNVFAGKPVTFDNAKCLAKTLIDHAVDLDAVTAAPEPPKASGGKKKFWNKRKGQSSQEPSKKQQVVAVHAATSPVAVPAAQAPTSRYVGTLPR